MYNYQRYYYQLKNIKMFISAQDYLNVKVKLAKK